MHKIGYLDVPDNYFKLETEDKVIICNSILDAMTYILDKHIRTRVDKKELLLSLIDASIIINEEEENYEVAGVLLDIRKMLNEETN